MKKRILFFINSMDKGGAERVLSILANEIVKKNDVLVVTLTNFKNQYTLDNRIKYYSLQKSERRSKNKIIKYLSFFPKTIIRAIKFRNVLKKEKPNIIISFLPQASYLAAFSNIKKIKLIISDRNDPNIEYKSFYQRFLMNIFYPKADGFVFQTEEAKHFFDKVINFSKKNYAIIPNPINLQFVCDRYEGKRENRIVSIGRLEKQKNFELLINAFNTIVKYFPDYTLTIYGDGSLRNELSNKIKSLGLENKIFLPGVVNNIKEEVYKAKLFIMTSNYEGIPNALIEAMSLGLTVISSDCPCGGPRMFIKNNENGLLFEVGNEQELVNKIRKILDNNEFCSNLGKNAQKIAKDLIPEKIVEEWEKIIDLVLENND